MASVSVSVSAPALARRTAGSRACHAGSGSTALVSVWSLPWRAWRAWPSPGWISMLTRITTASTISSTPPMG